MATAAKGHSKLNHLRKEISMYIPDVTVSALLVLIIILSFIIIHLEKSRLEARETARKHRDALYERPKQIVVYSDDVKENQIADYIQRQHSFFIAETIRNKEYLK
jgi:hypothetical protein